MDQRHEPLIRDLLNWIGPGDRFYHEVMDAWRTSCPHLPVWEEANDRGFVARLNLDGRPIVRVTRAGRDYLANK